MPTYDIRLFASKKSIEKNSVHPLFKIHRNVKRKTKNQDIFNQLLKIIGKVGIYSKHERYIENKELIN